MSIWSVDSRDVAQFLHEKRVLDLFLAEDVHEEKTECFVHTVYKVILDPFSVLNRELIQYILALIVAIPRNGYDPNIVDLISTNFAESTSTDARSK